MLSPSTRVFEDREGKIWIVTRSRQGVEVQGRRDLKESLYTIATSCALKLGVSQTKNGLPMDSIKEHNRIWRAIWKKGKAC